MKREKYSNGGLNAQKIFKGIGSIEGTLSAGQFSGSMSISKPL
tara:strand:+ start:36 stop:164 length:129 start_codon:yes stop_codon:yes gene_type:complete